MANCGDGIKTCQVDRDEIYYFEVFKSAPENTTILQSLIKSRRGIKTPIAAINPVILSQMGSENYGGIRKQWFSTTQDKNTKKY